jgi:hypothetical protein
VSELRLPACPICGAQGSLFRQTMERAGQSFVWYECQHCGSVLLWMGEDQWAYQKVGRAQKSHLLKRPMTAEDLRGLVPTVEEMPPPAPSIEPPPSARRTGMPRLLFVAIIVTGACVLVAAALMIVANSGLST